MSVGGLLGEGVVVAVSASVGRFLAAVFHLLDFPPWKWKKFWVLLCVPRGAGARLFLG